MENNWVFTALLRIIQEDLSPREQYELLEEAVELHKRDIIAAYNSGYKDAELDYGHDVEPDIGEYSNAENYYNEKIKK